MTSQQAGSSDFLFFYDTIDPRLVTEADIITMLAQRKGSLSYNRQYGCDLSSEENAPSSLPFQVNARADIVNAFAIRNGRVTSGANNLPDRRAFTSQSIIAIETDSQTGEVDISVPYIETIDLSAMKGVKVPGGK